MDSVFPRFRFSIDRGGTFTDIFCETVTDAGTEHRYICGHCLNTRVIASARPCPLVLA